MSDKKILGRRRGRVTVVVLAVVATAAMGAAKAEITPDPGSDLARAIFAQPPAPILGSSFGTPREPALGSALGPKAAPAFAFAAPVRGYPMNSRFGMRRLSFEPAARMHEGVDFAAPKGAPILATASGQVIRCGRSPTYGHFIEVAHGDGVSSFYAHMNRAPKLKVGQPVLAGDVVGFVGSTGRSTGAHLHFEIRKDGAQFDPALFIGRTFASFEALPFVRSARQGLSRVAALGRSRGQARRASTIQAASGPPLQSDAPSYAILGPDASAGAGSHGGASQ